MSDDSEEEDETDGGGESISKRQIKKLCEDMEATVAYLSLDIEPAAPLREMTAEDDGKSSAAPTIHALLQQFKDLRRRMSRLRLKLLPFKDRYEEEQAKRDSYEGLDEEEKARKKIEKDLQHKSLKPTRSREILPRKLMSRSGPGLAT